MDVGEIDVIAPLLHAGGMMFFPVIMGLSTSLCLRDRPSPFSTISVHEYVRLTAWLDRLWLFGILAWVALAISRWLGAGGEPRILVLTMIVSALATALLAARIWFRSVLAGELAATVGPVAAAGEVTTVSPDGICIAERREHDGILRFESASFGVRVYSSAGILLLAVFVAAAASAAGETAGPSFAQSILLAGLYVSLGVILVDLCEDVWPGFTTAERVKRASRYYVQIFEQWKNQGVLAGFLTVFIGAPLVYFRDEASLAVLSFPIWVGMCLCFATFFNQVLHRNGMIKSRLPLPVWVNTYSLAYPLWAHFFTVIHVVMVIALLVGLITLGI